MRRLGVIALILLAPAVASAGGAWTLEEGRLWGKLALVYQRSDQQFTDPISSLMLACGEPISSSDRMPFDCTTGGVFEVTALYADVMWGIVDGVDVRLQVPLVLSQSFWNESGLNAQQDVSLGDIRIGGQFRFIADPVLAALRWEVKIPTGFFTADEGIPAVGEGQWDLTAIAAVSRGVGDAWLSAEVGWRFRFENPTTGIDVGDEFLALGEVGYRFLPWLMVPFKFELIYGLESTNPTEPLGLQRADQRDPGFRGARADRFRARDPHTPRGSRLPQPARVLVRRVGRARHVLSAREFLSRVRRWR